MTTFISCYHRQYGQCLPFKYHRVDLYVDSMPFTYNSIGVLYTCRHSHLSQDFPRSRRGPFSPKSFCNGPCKYESSPIIRLRKPCRPSRHRIVTYNWPRQPSYPPNKCQRRTRIQEIPAFRVSTRPSDVTLSRMLVPLTQFQFIMIFFSQSIFSTCIIFEQGVRRCSPKT